MKKIPKTFVASLFALSAVLCVAHLSALNAQTLEKTAADDAAEESTRKRRVHRAKRGLFRGRLLRVARLPQRF